MGNHMRIIDIRGRGLTEQELTTLRATGSDDDYVNYRTKPTRYIEVDYEVRAKNKDDLRKKIDEVSGFIAPNREVPVIFKDELDRIYHCEYAGAIEDKEHYHLARHRGTMIFLRKSVKYSKEEKTITLDGPTLINNEGNEPADPIIELTATKPATFAMIDTPNDEYNLLGFPLEEGRDEIVEERTLIMNEDGSTLRSEEHTSELQS